MNNDFIIEDGTLISYSGNEKNVVVPDEVNVIKDYAFMDNTTIETIIIPNHATSEPKAYEGCSSLKYVVNKSVADFLYAKEPIKDNDLPMLDYESILAILRNGNSLTADKPAIQNYFEFNSTADKELTEYCKSLFENCYNDILVDGERYGYKPYDDVLHLWKGLYTSREAEISLSWEEVKNIYSDLIRKDELFKDSELEGGLQLSMFSMLDEPEVIEIEEEYDDYE